MLCNANESIKKTPEELQELHKAGLDMLYLGIESGSDIVLKKLQKVLHQKQLSKHVTKQKRLDSNYPVW